MHETKTEPDPARDELPRPTTFFLTERQRREVLRALRAHDTSCRARALCRALGVGREG